MVGTSGTSPTGAGCRFALTRTGDSRWILIKVRDDDARPGSDIVAERPQSVRSGGTWQELVRRSGE